MFNIRLDLEIKIMVLKVYLFVTQLMTYIFYFFKYLVKYQKSCLYVLGTFILYTSNQNKKSSSLKIYFSSGLLK